MAPSQDIQKQKAELMAELASLGHLIRGSLISTGKKCGRKTCACTKGKLHPHSYLSVSSGTGRNRTVYIKPSDAETVRLGIAAYQRAWEILDQLGALNVQLIKKG